ncbi:MAG TPA: NAD(P)H-binding protein [Actinomycetota bacterium]|nr:NAD(P)H-binding protein [Actinomycetota bacterium]
MSRGFDVVTGAFSYSGRAIAARLLEQGRTVRTLTRRRAPDGSPIEALPFRFDRPDELRAALTGADTVYNTYWVRFERGQVEFSEAVQNTITLINAAKDAGVRRFVHVSIIRPSLDSPLPYFKGKAVMEKALIQSGLSYAIVRPTVIFGRGDVFINNIAWILRRFPVFAVAGDGRYPIQPVHVDDLARICVEAGQSHGNLVCDAAGPESFTFREFVKVIGRGIGRNRPVFCVPVPVWLAISRVIGALVGDVVVNRQELDGLMAGLVASDQEPLGRIKLTDWISRHADQLGTTYSSEIGRNYERQDEKLLIAA